MVRITPDDDRAALRISDPIENAYYELFLDEDQPPDIEPVSDPQIETPIDEAVRIHVTEITSPVRVSAGVFTPELVPLGHVDYDDPGRPEAVDPQSTVALEIRSAPVKMYLVMPGDFHAEGGQGTLQYYYDEPRPVTVAVRSNHSKPAGTVTAGPGIESEMRAISTLGSALKSTAPDRAWPTLRGHPPLLEAGSSESIPDEVSVAPSDVTLHLPRDREAAYLAAPLAYYLNARIKPTDGTPRLTAAGRTHPITDFETDLNTLLRRVLLLDTLANRFGAFPHDLSIHDDALAVLDDDIDWRHIAQLEYPERTAAYLEPRLDPVVEEGIIPDWHLTTDLAPRRDTLGLLPFAAYDLSIVRTAHPQATGVLDEPPEAAVEFMRTDVQADEFMRAETALADSFEVVQPRQAETPAHQWAGDTPAWETTYLDEQALRRRTMQDPPPADDHVTSIRLVCNDPAMSHEFVEEIYGLRDLLSYDVTTEYGLSPDELADAFQEDEDLLHYIGHVDINKGLQCAGNEWLDLRTLDTVNIDTFVLNACDSYKQGQALLDAGAFAGVVTLQNVNNARATRIGQEFARLLDAGFRFRSALAVIQSFVPASNQYIVLGAAGHQIVTADGGTAMAFTVDERSDGRYDLTFQYYPTRHHGMGTVNELKLPNSGTYLGHAVADTLTVDQETLADFCELENLPVDWNGELLWTSDLAMVLSPETDRDIDDLLKEKYGLRSQPAIADDESPPPSNPSGPSSPE